MTKNESVSATSFKRCSLCNRVWHTKDEFLHDPDLFLNGYQFTSLNFRNAAKGGVLLFTHKNETCGTTLAVYARALKDHLDEPEKELIEKLPIQKHHRIKETAE